MTFDEWMENIARGFEIVGVMIITIGGVYALLHGFRNFAHPAGYFDVVRRDFGRPLILGLEILVAADIITTITIEATLESVGVLGILVAVRIALSFSLDIEIDGMVPWRKAQSKARLASLSHADKPAATPSGSDDSDA